MTAARASASAGVVALREMVAVVARRAVVGYVIVAARDGMAPRVMGVAARLTPLAGADTVPRVAVAVRDWTDAAARDGVAAVRD